MGIGKTALELEAMMMDRLRGNRSCAALAGIDIVPDGSECGWRTRLRAKLGHQVPFDCRQAVIQVARELSGQYSLASDHPQPPTQPAYPEPRPTR